MAQRKPTTAKLFALRPKGLDSAKGLLAAIVESSNDAIISRALDGTINSWNRGAEKLFGYSAEEAIGQSYNFLIPEDGEMEERERLNDIRENIHIATSETTRITKDGRRISIMLRVSPILDAKGKIIGSSRIVSDISDKLEADRANALLAAIVESSQDAIMSKTLEGVVTSWNPGATQLFGYTAEEAIGKHISFLIPREKQMEEDRIIRHLKVGKRIQQTETVRLHKDGTPIAVSLSISPICDRHGKIIGASKVARDISDRKEMEQAQEQLRQSQKMESIGQLTGGIAHDFNNLLAVVLGNLDFMFERTKDDDPLREFIKPSIEAAEHGAELTQQLLAFGRKQSLQPKIVAINELLHYFTTLVRHTLGERITTVMSLAPDLWNVNIDASQLQNALLNLSVNARDAMPDGGKLIFETKNVTFSKAEGDAADDVTPGDYVMVSVTDTGEGMTDDVIEKAFEPFFTTKDVGKGSGLGLSMVYGFVKQSSGHVKIYSEYGQGTSMRIYLPRAEGSSNTVPREKESATPIRNARKPGVILVVEDNKEVLKLTSAIVASLGYEVLKAENGDIAIEILKNLTDIDMLLTDVMLPGTLNGPVLAKQAVALHPRMKVLFNSGYAKDAILQQGLLEEGMNLISKPFRKQQLAEKIATILKPSEGTP